MIGNSATGIYAVANKVPNVLMTVAGIFTSAWQISTVTEQPKAEKERFFSNVFAAYAAVSTLASDLLIFALRAVHIRKLLRIRYHAGKLLISVLILCVQCVLAGWNAPPEKAARAIRCGPHAYVAAFPASGAHLRTVAATIRRSSIRSTWMCRP